MRPSPTAVFVALALAMGVGAAAFAKQAAGADDEGPAVPSDASRFGFAVRGRVADVAILEATRPFRLELGNGPVAGREPSAAEAASASRVLARELGRYPAGFFRRVRLAGVVLIGDLVEGATPIPSLPNVGGLLLFDAGGAEMDLVRALHHEIFHFVDLADDGHLAPDPEWEALNAPSFAYGSGGRTLRGAWAAQPSEELAGFISPYATSAVEEDKAETFAFVVARPELVRARLSADDALGRKVRLVAHRLASVNAEAPARLGFPAGATLDQSSAAPR